MKNYVVRDKTREVDWGFRKQQTKDLEFMVYKRIVFMKELYGNAVTLESSFQDYPPRIEVAVRTSTREQYEEFWDLLAELSMFTLRYVDYQTDRKSVYESTMLLFYIFDEYSYKKEK